MMNTNVCMGENDYLTDMLTTEKHVMNCYSTGIMEASCPNLRQVFTSQYEQSAADQFKIFETMSQRGLYPTPAAPDNEVTQAQQKYTQIKNNIC